MAFELSFTAQEADIDELGHVNNAVWVQWVQHISTSHWFAQADPAHVDRYFWMITRHEIDYVGNIELGETVIARTWISDPPKGARFNRNVEFVNQAGKVLVRSKSTWAIMDRTVGRIVRVPQEVAATFLPDDA